MLHHSQRLSFRLIRTNREDTLLLLFTKTEKNYGFKIQNFIFKTLAAIRELRKCNFRSSKTSTSTCDIDPFDGTFYIRVCVFVCVHCKNQHSSEFPMVVLGSISPSVCILLEVTVTFTPVVNLEGTI